MQTTLDEKMIVALQGISDVQAALLGIRRSGDTIGNRILKSADYRAFAKHESNMLTLSLETKTAIVGTSLATDPLGTADKSVIDGGTRRPLTVRQLIPNFKTEASAIELPVATSKTNNAGIQVGGSPQQFQNVTLGESAYGFEASFVPLATIGHFLPASNQILEDAGQLSAFIEAELMQGLAEAIETQLVLGTGANGQLNGLVTEATAFANTSPLTYTTRLDILREAIRQVQAARFRPSAVVLNPTDWRNIELGKDTANAYLAGNPHAATQRLWGLPVIVTTAITAGTFLVGDLRRAAVIFEHGTPSVQIARSDDSDFQKNMLKFKVCARLAQVITNPLALITGTLP